MKWILKILLAFTLTVLTQIGGVLYLLNELFWNRKRPLGNRWVKNLSFVLIYCFATFVLVPQLAKLGERKALPVLETNKLQPLNVLTCILNRHYVTNRLYDVVMKTSLKVNKKEGILNYLDANFPFFTGFPLLPHLSHNDGKKLDLALSYMNSKDQMISNSAPSFIGYGVSVEPRSGAKSTADVCSQKGYWQYGLLNKVISHRYEKDFVFDQNRTKRLLEVLLEDKRIGKIFIEPHLIQRMGLSHAKLRFHGCHAVRHDDHIHIQLK